MPSQSDVASQIRQALMLSEPDLDTSIGTTVRKIIDSFSEVIAEAYIDNFLLSFQYDVDSKSGADLDSFVAVFGFNRYPAVRATGVVTFALQVPSTQNILIPIGTQVATNAAPQVVFSTIVPALLAAGQVTIDVPIQAVIGGSSGNVGANTINTLVTALNSISSLSNAASTTGGVDIEGDDALRTRFKTTVFRSMAGTEQMFLGVALNNPAVTQANVIGAMKSHREQIQLVGGTATSQIQNAAYIYDDPTFGVAIDQGQILTENVHYTFNAGVIPPTITSIDATNAPNGIYDLLFDYLPTASRNQPASGITNRIDIYVNGNAATSAVEQQLFSNAKTFNTVANDPLNINNFVRKNGSLPVSGNVFTKLSMSPVTEPATGGTITIGATTYTEGVDFFLVNDVTASGGTPSSNSGIEWVVGGAHALPANGTPVTYQYVYNAVPKQVQIAIQQWRLVAFDVKVHQALKVLLNLYMAVILVPGYSLASVQSTMFTALANFIGGIGFDGIVQISDLLQVAHQVSGVDAVRFLVSSDDAVHFGIQGVAADGTTLIHSYDNGATVKRPIDVLVNDNALPVLNSLVLVQKAENSFSSGLV